MTIRVSITGVDGTGKTSIIRAIQREFASAPERVRAFRAPQYHENPRAPRAALSAWIDQLSKLADALRDPQLKACALFLSMTLYGDVEAHYLDGPRPRFLFSERQALADSLAYARFYKALLAGPLVRERLEAPVLERLGADGARALEAWAADRGLDFWELPLFIRDVFELPAEALIDRLRALYRCEPPDAIILLKVAPERLMERLAEKAQGGAPRELHERRDVLEVLHLALEASCRLVVERASASDLHRTPAFHLLDTSALSLGQATSACLALVGAAPT